MAVDLEPMMSSILIFFLILVVNSGWVERYRQVEMNLDKSNEFTMQFIYMLQQCIRTQRTRRTSPALNVGRLPEPV